MSVSASSMWSKRFNVGSNVNTSISSEGLGDVDDDLFRAVADEPSLSLLLEEDDDTTLLECILEEEDDERVRDCCLMAEGLERSDGADIWWVVMVEVVVRLAKRRLRAVDRVQENVRN